MNSGKRLQKLGVISQLRDHTYLIIRRAICDGILEPGDALVEAELAEQLGVSKTPVREALMRLELEGLVKRIPHTGSYVLGIRIDDIEEIYTIKRELEALAVRLVTPTLTSKDLAEAEALLEAESDLWRRGNVTCEELEKVPSFHEWVRNKSGNQRLTEMMRGLDTLALRVRITLSRLSGWVNLSEEDHRGVLDAMASGDAGLAAECIKQHNDRVLDQLKKLHANGSIRLEKQYGGR